MTKQNVIKLTITAVAAVIVVAAVLVYAKVDPSESIFFPKCLFHSLTGLDCPGCGSQRAIHSLLNGDFLSAIKYNVLVVIALPYIAVYLILSTVSSLSKNDETTSMVKRITDSLYRGKAVYIVLFLILIFWVVRNLI